MAVVGRENEIRLRRGRVDPFVNKVKQVDRRITISEPRELLNMKHCSTCTLLQTLSYSNVKANWIPKMMTDSMKE